MGRSGRAFELTSNSMQCQMFIALNNLPISFKKFFFDTMPAYYTIITCVELRLCFVCLYQSSDVLYIATKSKLSALIG